VQETPIVRKHGRQRNTKEQMECGVDGPAMLDQMDHGTKSQACRNVQEHANFKL
jgi:hypothetical protein